MGGAGCPLKVFVKQLETLRSGLAVHSIHYKQAPVDFMSTKTEDGLPQDVCESGCVDILVSVIDPKTHKAPDPYATVSASLGDLRLGQQILNGVLVSPPAYGDGSLCEVSTQEFGGDEKCGASLSDLQTDTKGQVHLRYWAPGVVAAADTTLTVTAECDVTPCTAARTTSHTTLHVDPYLIYDHTATISDEDLQDMVNWVRGEDPFTEFLESDTEAYDALKYGLKLVEHEQLVEKEAEAALAGIEKVEPIAIVFDVALELNAVYEAMGMFALFLENTGLSPIGLGREPFEASVDGNPTALFVHELINQQAVPSLFRVSDGGFWYASASAVRKEVLGEKNLELQDWSVETNVYEVSHCDDQLGSCGQCKSA